MSYSTKHYRGDAKKTAMTPAEVAARAAEAIRPSEATLAYAAQLASGNMAQAAEDPSSVIDSEVLTSLIDDDQVEEDLAFEANLKRQLAAGAVTQEQAKVMLAERQRAANLKFDAALEKALRDKKITKTEALAIKREKTRGIAQVKATARGAAKAVEATNAATGAVTAALGNLEANLGGRTDQVERAVRDAITEVGNVKTAVESAGTDTKAALGVVSDRLLVTEQGNDRRHRETDERLRKMNNSAVDRHGELMRAENLGGLGQRLADMREELLKRDFDAAMARAATREEREAVLAAAGADYDEGDDPGGADARFDESDIYEGVKNFAGKVASMFTPKTPRTLVSELSAGTPGQDDEDDDDDGAARAAPAPTPTSKIPKPVVDAQIHNIGPDGVPAAKLWADAGGAVNTRKRNGKEEIGSISSGGANSRPAKLVKALFAKQVVTSAGRNLENFYIKGYTPEGRQEAPGTFVGRAELVKALRAIRNADLNVMARDGLAGFLANHAGAREAMAKGLGGLDEAGEQDEPKKKEVHRVKKPGRPSNRPDPSARREIAMALLEQAESDIEGARRMFLALRQKDVFPNQELSGIATEINQIHTRLHHQAGHKGKPRPLRLRMPLEKIQQLEPDLELPAL